METAMKGIVWLNYDEFNFKTFRILGCKLHRNILNNIKFLNSE